MRQFIVFFAMVSFFVTEAQKSKAVSWSSNRKQSKENVTNIFHSDEDYFYTYGIKSRSGSTVRETHISKYDKNKFKRVWTELVSEYKYDGVKATFEAVEFINDQAYLFLESYIKDEEKKILLLKKIDSDGNVGDFQVLDEVYTTKKSRGDLFIRVSKYSGKFVVLSRPKSKKNDNFTMKVKVFDENADELWNKEIVLDLPEKVVNINDVQVSEEGEVFLLIDDLSDARSKRKNNQTDFRMLKVSGEDEDDFEELNLNLKAYLFKATMEIDNTKGKAILSAIYSDKKGANMAGVFIGVVDQNSFEEESLTYSEFTPQFLDQASIHLKVKDGKIRSSSGFYKLRAMIETEDEGTLVVNEYYYMVVVERYDSRGMYMGSTTHYYYNHVIVTKIDKQGELQWNEFVPKIQQTTDDNGVYSGLAINYREGVLSLMFNDNPKNMQQLRKNKRLKNTRMKKSAMVIVQIDDEGSSTRKIVQDNKAKKTIFQPRNTIPSSTANTEFITMGAYYFNIFSSRDFRFGVIKL